MSWFKMGFQFKRFAFNQIRNQRNLVLPVCAALSFFDKVPQQCRDDPEISGRYATCIKKHTHYARNDPAVWKQCECFLRAVSIGGKHAIDAMKELKHIPEFDFPKPIKHFSDLPEKLRMKCQNAGLRTGPNKVQIEQLTENATLLMRPTADRGKAMFQKIPAEICELGIDEIEIFLSKKHGSHILPHDKLKPETALPENIFWENDKTNLKRKQLIATKEEIKAAELRQKAYANRRCAKRQAQIENMCRETSLKNMLEATKELFPEVGRAATQGAVFGIAMGVIENIMSYNRGDVGAYELFCRVLKEGAKYAIGAAGMCIIIYIACALLGPAAVDFMNQISPILTVFVSLSVLKAVVDAIMVHKEVMVCWTVASRKGGDLEMVRALQTIYMQIDETRLVDQRMEVHEKLGVHKFADDQNENNLTKWVTNLTLTTPYTDWHSHNSFDEYIYIRSGVASFELNINGKIVHSVTARKGDRILIPACCPHRVRSADGRTVKMDVLKKHF